MQRRLAIAAEVAQLLRGASDGTPCEWSRHRGDLMLAQHFARLWDSDLRVRLEVRGDKGIATCMTH